MWKRFRDLERWVTATQFLINGAMIYVAAFDRGLVIDLIVKIWRKLNSFNSEADSQKHKSKAEKDRRHKNPESARPKPELIKTPRVDKVVTSGAPTSNNIAPPASIEKQQTAFVPPKRYKRISSKKPKRGIVIVLAIAVIVFALLVWSVLKIDSLLRSADVKEPVEVVEISDDEPVEESTQASNDEIEPIKEELKAFKLELRDRKNETCWEVSARCTGSGYRWKELLQFQPDLDDPSVECKVMPDTAAWKVPSDWEC
jgi:hypothetical protein